MATEIVNPWRPVLEGRDAERARALIATIADQLVDADLDDPSLAEGHAGIALLHGYRARAGEADGADRATAAFELALARIDSDPRPFLFYGYAGIAFALHHLTDVIGDVSETLDQLDDLIARSLAIDPWPNDWELMLGRIGIGVYALERGSSTLLDGVVAYLAERAEHNARGIAWRAHYPGAPPELTHYNLGIAHGVAGAIGFLSAVCARPDAPAKARELLIGATTWLRSYEDPEQVPSVPMTIDHHIEQEVVVDGWCYGEPSTAVVLARAGQVLHDTELIEGARALALRCARRPLESIAGWRLDVAMCHGSAGRAFMLHRLGNAFGDEELRAAARDWYVRTLDRCDGGELPDEPGVAWGRAGVALALLAATSAIEPLWDRLFLLSLES